MGFVKRGMAAAFLAAGLVGCDVGAVLKGMATGDSDAMSKGMMPAAYTPFMYGLEGASAGSWVEYENRAGQEQPGKPKGKFRVAVVGTEGANRWVEIGYGEGQDRLVMAYLVAPNRDVVKAYMGTAGKEGMPMRVEPLPQSAAQPGQPRQDSDYQVDSKTSSDTITVPAGKFKGDKIVTTITNKKDGSKHVSTAWMSKDVPFGHSGAQAPAGASGGMVKMDYDGQVSMELAGKGKDAKPSLIIPVGK